jgi:hypothetical protein
MAHPSDTTFVIRRLSGKMDMDRMRHLYVNAFDSDLIRRCLGDQTLSFGLFEEGDDRLLAATTVQYYPNSMEIVTDSDPMAQEIHAIGVSGGTHRPALGPRQRIRGTYGEIHTGARTRRGEL